MQIIGREKHGATWKMHINSFKATKGVCKQMLTKVNIRDQSEHILILEGENPTFYFYKG